MATPQIFSLLILEIMVINDRAYLLVVDVPIRYLWHSLCQFISGALTLHLR